MRIKQIIDEDFVNYRKPSMFISSIKCSGKCYKELGLTSELCQNNELVNSETIDMKNSDIYNRYSQNEITKAIVIGGLEPFEQFEELKELIKEFRIVNNCKDDIVIYTGYYPQEITSELEELSEYENIVIKFGRFIPNLNKMFDQVLGIELSSFNQFANALHK